MNDLSVCLVDDHKLFREGMKLLLGRLPFIREVREASGGQEFLDSLSAAVPDVVFMDIEMPGMSGIETTRLALEKAPHLHVIALSMYGEEEYYTKMIGAGVKGFLLKNSSIREVEDAIVNVVEGKNYFSQEVVTSLVQGLTRKKKSGGKGDLSEREAEVLIHICKGYSNKEIADTLFLSKRTVDKHRENILLKTGAKNTAGLVMYAIQSGIIEL
ncbi:MAG TPA: response regulator transcription factor [Bacteroides sp.]|nr:response regulator transcription factor [Bacteroides sp.]